MSELKRCPFCGGEGYIDIASERPKNYTIRCNCCRMSTRWFEDKQKATDAWNCRADEWIAVEDRLPEPGAFVLTLLKGRPEVGRFIGVGFICVGWSFRTWWAEPTDVTHWMPLPEPPEEETIKQTKKGIKIRSLI